MSEIMFLIGRVFFGIIFIWSGVDNIFQNTRFAIYAQSKNIPLPRITVFIFGLMSVLGGLGIILGIYIKISVLLLCLFLAGTLYKVHTFWKESDSLKMDTEKKHFLKNLALLGAALMFLSILSPWTLSL